MYLNMQLIALNLGTVEKTFQSRDNEYCGSVLRKPALASLVCLYGAQTESVATPKIHHLTRVSVFSHLLYEYRWEIAPCHLTVEEV
jgi:hypothetical protein